MADTIFGKEPRKVRITCPQCKSRFTAQMWTNINTALQPELKKLCVNGSLMKFRCLRCRHVFKLEHTLLYFDPDNKFIVGAVPKPLLTYTDAYFKNIFGDFPDYTPDFRKRVITNMRSFSETVRIFEYGLDDRAVHLMKLMIEFDYQEQKKTPPKEIVFLGMVTNFNRAEFQFTALDGDAHQTLYSSEGDYKYCLNLIEKYIQDGRSNEWLMISRYFSRGFLDIAFEKYKKEEREAQFARLSSLHKSICAKIQKNDTTLLALLKVSNIQFDDEVSIAFEFKSVILTEKMKNYVDKLSILLEQVLGFAPDIILRTKPTAKKSTTR